jgi:hypothetical protein
MFWLLAIYGGTNLLKYFSILGTSTKIHCRIYHLKIYKNGFKKKSFADVDGLSYAYKMVEIHHQKNSVTSLIFILN